MKLSKTEFEKLVEKVDSTVAYIQDLVSNLESKIADASTLESEIDEVISSYEDRKTIIVDAKKQMENLLSVVKKVE